MFKPFASNPACEGCSILDKGKPFNAYLDYEKADEADILFLSDSLKTNAGGGITAFGKKDIELFIEVMANLEGDATIEFAASVKCPAIRDKDLSASDMKLCRTHLEATIDAIKPKLVFTCGNLPMRMLLRLSGLTGPNPKRGRHYEFTSQKGHTCVVVPLFHPYSVIREPRHRPLFEMDIKNAYNRVILGKKAKSEFDFEIVTDIKLLQNEYIWLCDTDLPLGMDLEMTGLDFKKDKIMTFSISSKRGTVVIPIFHREHEWNTVDIGRVIAFLAMVMENPNNKKIFHNSKFDLKFLMALGLTKFENIYDTMILSHNIDENTPNSLSHNVQQYFSDEYNSLC